MKFDKTITTILAIISILLLFICSFYLINYFINTECSMDYKNYLISNKRILDANEFGDYFGGIMNPIIGLSAAFITFLAFYIQFVANKQITNQFKVQQFESHFYEMLRLHKENVNEIQIEQTTLVSNRTSAGVHINWTKSYNEIKGRDVFIYFSNELEIAYKTILKINFDKEIAFDEAYKTFFNGLEKEDKFFNELLAIKNIHKTEFIDRTVKTKQSSNEIDGITIKSTFPLFEGHENNLGHYYRHLYHTVKFVVNYDNKIIDYTNKRKYLQLLRAQLSNFEQVMLFYNWVSGYGKAWEDNKFFSDYRMIHNLSSKLFLDEDFFIKIKEDIRINNPKFLTIPNKLNDYLYESDG
ncbi:Putative phage abortive infection protein [Chryseobacterium scophthalmum]|uniref:Putative phage abortive infection protein n=2 Tax=Chryseobacterium scophthalmum TaxID=59733 RepID=A0A1N6IN75_9FLAO|nr:Putative phage abortive infection protein [Chryseobacterium scophthalmum]